MSLYTPDAITDADLDISRDPMVGGELRVKLSRSRARILGYVEMTNSGTGTYTAVAGESVSDPVAGVDLALVALKPIKSAVTCVVTLNVEDAQGDASTVVATFATPARCADQSHNMPVAVAVDGVMAEVNTGIKVGTIESVASIVGGSRGMKFAVVELPALADYTEVGCTTDKKFNLKEPTFIGIACGLENDAFVKKGMTQAGDLTINCKYRGHLEALSRFSGQRCTALLERYADNELLTERYVFHNYGPSVSISAPEGDGVVTEDAASGKYETALVFVAP